MPGHLEGTCQDFVEGCVSPSWGGVRPSFGEGVGHLPAEELRGVMEGNAMGCVIHWAVEQGSTEAPEARQGFQENLTSTFLLLGVKERCAQYLSRGRWRGPASIPSTMTIIGSRVNFRMREVRKLHFLLTIGSSYMHLQWYTGHLFLH